MLVAVPRSCQYGPALSLSLVGLAPSPRPSHAHRPNLKTRTVPSCVQPDRATAGHGADDLVWVGGSAIEGGNALAQAENHDAIGHSEDVGEAMRYDQYGLSLGSEATDELKDVCGLLDP